MIHQIYSIKDTVVDSFLPTFLAQNDKDAQRMLHIAKKDPNHQFSKSTNDYYLHNIGEFDDSTGIIDALDQPILIQDSPNLSPDLEA